MYSLIIKFKGGFIFMEQENQLQVFTNEKFGEVRTTKINGEPWFVGKDIAEKLGYKNPRDAVYKRVDTEDKGVCKMETPSGSQEMTIINESGMYSLILGSKLPQAKEFKRWVTSEVLPSLRKNGTYSIETSNVNTNLVDLVQATITNIIPLIATEMGKLVIQSQDKIDQSIEMLHNQSVVYDDDREKLKDLIGFHSVNTTRIVKTIKELLSEKLGYKVYANAEIFQKVKKVIFKEYKVIKWEDIPVEKYEYVFAFLDEYISEMESK
jgi:prophage antirepressor-like protein